MLWVFSDTPLGIKSSIITQCLDDHDKDENFQANFDTESKLT